MIFISMLITLIGFLVGVSVGNHFGEITLARPSLLVLSVVFFAPGIASKISDQASYLKDFASSWDEGNTYAVGHPFQNSYPYNVEQQARLADVTSRPFIAPSFSVDSVLIDNDGYLRVSPKTDIPSVLGTTVPIQIERTCEISESSEPPILIHVIIGESLAIPLVDEPGCYYEVYAVDHWTLGR